MLIFLLPITGMSQTLDIPENIIKEAHNLSMKDSIEVKNHIDKLLLPPEVVDLEDLCRNIGKIRYVKWLKFYNEAIVKYVGYNYIKSSYCADLLSLVDLPKDLRDTLLSKKNGYLLAKARLGDSVAIDYFIKEYLNEKNKDNFDYQSGRVSSNAMILLSLNSKKALKLLFTDIESEIKIKKNESIIDGVYHDVYYTLPYAIIIALKENNFYEPLFQEKYMYQFLEAESPEDVNPNINQYYKLVEDFIRKEYGCKVKINTPYLIAGWPAYGYF